MKSKFYIIIIHVMFISCINNSELIVLGHRGAMGYAVENTLTSIEKAIEE